MHIREYKPDQSFRGSIDTMDEIEDFETYWQSTFRGKCRGTARKSLPTWMTQTGFCLRCMQKRLQIFFQPSAGHDGSVRPAVKE